MSGPSRRQTLSLGLGAGLAAGLPAAEAADGIEDRKPTFTLVLVNDVYLMSEVDGRGGFARLNAVVKAERARGVPVLYAHAGDTISPSLMSGFDKGAHIMALLALASPDVFVPGNHEFDFGPAVFQERIRGAAFRTLAANLRDEAGQALPGVADRFVTDLGGIRVGVTGIALESTPEKAQAGTLRFGPEEATLAEQARQLRAEGAEIVVAVVHTARPTDLAMLAAGQADLILSGHDHDLFLRYDGQRVLCESSVDAHFVTAIDVFCTIREEDGRRRVSWRPRFRIHDTHDVTPDPETAALVAHYEAELSNQLDVPVGRTALPLDSRVASVRAREASFGDLVADALRAATGADIALMNGGGIRGNRLYPAGTELTRRDILQELPFGNTTVLVAIDGAALHALLENGLADYGRPAGRLVQVSGLVIRLDPERPQGARILSVTVDGAPLDLGRIYTVAANNFLYDGGNGYGALRSGRTLIGTTDGKLVANEVMTYIRRNSPISIREGERLVVVR
ncbi:bifunctional metallophosphatase/5'-nucleotidase [Methylobacterium symbioticum]|uniref:Mannosylglucosyl-3-phosphoglycerate phosphatase n=1 Tax=Methylobacterium symbioticum TaxID=2584084 RepID=A0A509EBC5_9HYPH|nr:bifunctional UDP-sugar hydrolase/5'-nucleotidase [Methylobacterium symbioticum]VUD71501.1 Mannosylglucosyl-3-phosphoglycerate phosphatase [Methylobacterium symbioticum]